MRSKHELAEEEDINRLGFLTQQTNDDKARLRLAPATTSMKDGHVRSNDGDFAHYDPPLSQSLSLPLSLVSSLGGVERDVYAYTHIWQHT